MLHGMKCFLVNLEYKPGSNRKAGKVGASLRLQVLPLRLCELEDLACGPPIYAARSMLRGIKGLSGRP